MAPVRFLYSLLHNHLTFISSTVSVSVKTEKQKEIYFWNQGRSYEVITSCSVDRHNASIDLSSLTFRGCCIWVSLIGCIRLRMAWVDSFRPFLPVCLFLPPNLWNSCVCVCVCVTDRGPKSQLTGTASPPSRPQMSPRPWPHTPPSSPPLFLDPPAQHVCPRGALLPASDCHFTWGFQQHWRRNKRVLVVVMVEKVSTGQKKRGLHRMYYQIIVK